MRVRGNSKYYLIRKQQIQLNSPERLESLAWEGHKNFSLKNMRGERWKPIIGFTGWYQVSNMGRVKQLKRLRGKRVTILLPHEQKILRPGRDGADYLGLILRSRYKQKQCKIHRLVADAFIPNPKKKRTVNHKYGVVYDNRAKSLQWMTDSENVKHAFDVLGYKGSHLGKKSKDHHLSKRVAKLDMEGNVLETMDSISDFNRKYGFNRGSISNVCRGITAHVYGYKWKYL